MGKCGNIGGIEHDLGGATCCEAELQLLEVESAPWHLVILVPMVAGAEESFAASALCLEHQCGVLFEGASLLLLSCSWKASCLVQLDRRLACCVTCELC